MAGGAGTRLWPISTTNNPKQFLKLYNDEIMINETIKRVENLFDFDNIFIVINESQKEMAKRYVDSKIPRDNIIIEPMAKNTAMCIFYSTLKIKKMKGDGVIAVFSSDHYINNEKALQNSIQESLMIAEKNEYLVTIGIFPSYPATCYGYLGVKEKNDENGYIVDEFKEKPNYEKALEYVESGHYFWNSGMFFWKTSVILKNFEENLKDISFFQNEIMKCINTEFESKKMMQIYQNIENISIDKGIMEKANSIRMVKADFEWSDIGNIKSYFDTLRFRL